ncbi:hypothetical protein Y032_0329g2661 [Ancylostoma ceylanicum]|uniref:Uncharacterized protein n=1 Tax=Ancylostoma ceylanicum TaxID=53326 RepID=A0A016RZJ4_9BILA|nr:hypothetical protein Y032_0329g2661 [Ancylostoma ceylanicum]
MGEEQRSSPLMFGGHTLGERMFLAIHFTLEGLQNLFGNTEGKRVYRVCRVSHGDTFIEVCLAIHFSVLLVWQYIRRISFAWAVGSLSARLPNKSRKCIVINY